MDILYAIGALLIIAPVFLFILTILFARKRLGYRSIGLAADVTTLLLFFSVPAAAAAIWQVDTILITFSTAIIIAILLLVIEWKQSKEIEIPKLARKTWRVYFLALSLAYFLICLAGLLLTFNDYFQIISLG